MSKTTDEKPKKKDSQIRMEEDITKETVEKKGGGQVRKNETRIESRETKKSVNEFEPEADREEETKVKEETETKLKNTTDTPNDRSKTASKKISEDMDIDVNIAAKVEPTQKTTSLVNEDADITKKKTKTPADKDESSSLTVTNKGDPGKSESPRKKSEDINVSATVEQKKDIPKKKSSVEQDATVKQKSTDINISATVEQKKEIPKKKSSVDQDATVKQKSDKKPQTEAKEEKASLTVQSNATPDKLEAKSFDKHKVHTTTISEADEEKDDDPHLVPPLLNVPRKSVDVDVDSPMQRYLDELFESSQNKVGL